LLNENCYNDHVITLVVHCVRIKYLKQN